MTPTGTSVASAHFPIRVRISPLPSQTASTSCRRAIIFRTPAASQDAFDPARQKVVDAYLLL
jgi:hypothetical protein